MASPPRNILCILAGGESRRFGSSKLNIHIGGEPILAWQVRRLLGGVGRAVPGKAVPWLSLAPTHPATLPGLASFERFVQDATQHAGPLAGMIAVLNELHARDTVAFVPADMPLLEPTHLQSYAQVLAEEPDAIGVMGKWIDGPSKERVEPFPSVWRAQQAKALLLQRHANVTGPAHLAMYQGVFCAGLEHERDARAWTSINRREDMKVIERALGKRVTPGPADASAP